MKKLLPVLFIGIIATLGSCKRCYVCTLENVEGSYHVDTTYQFEICNKGGQTNNGQSLNDALKSYEANGYNCVAK